jgi:hypothetical protein
MIKSSACAKYKPPPERKLKRRKFASNRAVNGTAGAAVARLADGDRTKGKNIPGAYGRAVE